MKTVNCSSMGFLVSMIVLCFAPAASQVTVQAGAGGGVLLPMADYSGQTTDYYAGTKYGLSTGYTFHAKARVGVLGFTIVGGVDYGHLSNSGNGEAGRGTVDVKQSILTFKLGPEFSIPIPLSPVMPYIGANVALNSISGTTSFQGLTKVPSGSFDVPAVSRLGVGINAGVVLKLGPMLTLDLGAEYAFRNLTGKAWTVVDAKNDARVNAYKALNDDKDPLYAPGNDNHFISGSRSISTFEVTATIMFGL